MDLGGDTGFEHKMNGGIFLVNVFGKGDGRQGNLRSAELGNYQEVPRGLGPL